MLLFPSLRHPHWCHCAHKKRRAGVQLTNEIERMEAPNLPKYWNPDGTWNYDVPNKYKLSRSQEIYWALCRIFPDGKGGYDAAKCGNHNTVTGLSINHPGFGFIVLNIGIYGILIRFENSNSFTLLQILRRKLLPCLTQWSPQKKKDWSLKRRSLVGKSDMP